MTVFKKGDIVRLKRDSLGYAEGRIFEVTSGPHGSGMGGNYHLNSKNGTTVLLGDTLEKTKFQVGDKVKKYGLEAYGTYTIDSVSLENGSYVLTGGDLGTRKSMPWWHDDELYSIKEEEMATVSKFKVGDIVTTDDELFYKILAVTKYGYVTSEGEFEYETAKKSEVADSELILNESEHDYHTTDGVREYTLEEIANELGVGVRSIRIKD